MSDYYYFMLSEICVNLNLTVDLETGGQTIHYITVSKNVEVLYKGSRLLQYPAVL